MLERGVKRSASGGTTQSARSLALIACCVLVTPAAAQSVADFYKGKPIHMVVGTEAGQDYDTWARLVTRHMREYIPGNPTFVVENMPGAGSLIAANYLYNKAATGRHQRSAWSAATFPNYAFMRQPNANFDPLKFNWIGSPEMTHRGCYARADSGIETPEDLFVRELPVGGDGAGTALTETPMLLKNLLGMKFKVIDGYKGATGVVLAMERSEVEGICQTTMRILRQPPSGCSMTAPSASCSPPSASRCPSSRCRPSSNTPRPRSSGRSCSSMHRASSSAGPILAPPNIPADRVAALRHAFDGRR